MTGTLAVKIKLCIFDLDGTLAKTQESIARPVNMTLSYYGLPPQPVEAFNYFAGDGLKNALKRALAAAGDTDSSHLEEGLPMCRAWMQEDPCFHAEPYDGIVQALEELKKDDVKIAVFSNKPHESAVSVVETIFGKGFFDHIQGQTDEIPIKPDPEGVFEILTKYGAEKEECLYFGDTNTDMLTGHNAGVTTVGVTWGFRPRSELEEYGADIIIDSPKEIPMLTAESEGADSDMMSPELPEDRLTALGESEMEMFRFLLDRPAGVILTVETDMMLAKLLASAGLARTEADMVIIPENIRSAYMSNWSDRSEQRWRKRNWMYKCLEAGMYLYGVMTWEVLRDLFALRYPDAGPEEVRELFETTPANCQWFTEREGRLVLNGYEKDDYYIGLEQIQRDIPFYIPTAEETEELFEQGSLISLEAHSKLREFITETFDCDPDTAALKVHELYEAVNNRVRVNDAVDAFAEGGAFSFPSDEAQVRFIELYIEMSRECRVRDNRGHDYYEMVALMAKRGQEKKAEPVKRIKIGRNEPCPCGSGKKYKNCCGKS